MTASTASAPSTTAEALAELVAVVREAAARFKSVADHAAHTRQNTLAAFYQDQAGRLTTAADRAEAAL